MKKLQLSLFKEHFDKTKARIKKEDYRKLDAYWFSRLVLVKGEKKSQKWWYGNYLLFFDQAHMQRIFKQTFYYEFSFAEFDINRMTLGYPSATDKDRILELEHKGIEIREGNPDWGAEPGVLYFCILHGDILPNQ